MNDDLTGIWLRVVNARSSHKKLEVQLEGDKQDHGRAWWPVVDSAYQGDHEKNSRAVLDGLDKKRTVLAKLVSDQGEGGHLLHCASLRILHSEPHLS